ncbi:anti-phage dCTP deaminase [Henriciella litoralis]|uniref:anti-phage dCTP deaminase n=1 Tax=Henriciella litoralis TaxID=568102 RepID=UPI000A0279AF|nr:anti-phage dCTP deaminase [Henriciella litoralis]
MAAPKVQNLIKGRVQQSGDEAVDLMKRRQTPELVIGFIGAVGAGVSTSKDIIAGLMHDHYGYTPTHYKISDIIKESKKHTSFQGDVADAGDQRIKDLQKIGSELREKFGAGYLAAKVIELIAVGRGNDGYEDEEFSNPKSRRVVHVIDSIKNESEAELLRAVYGSAFWLVGVFANENVREIRLKKMGVSELEIKKVISIDEHEGPDHGQDVRDTFILSDYFLNNNSDEKSKLKGSLERLLEVIFSTTLITPEADESGMAAAQQAAASSACLSRQVGAVIRDQSDSTIGTGWNEVPKFGGGTYPDFNTNLDKRCFKSGSEKCRNDEYKENLFNDVILAAQANGLPTDKLDNFKSELSKTRIKSLSEFSRSVHAEMAAIVDVARNGSRNLAGSTLFVTTFPCHNCARHIVFAGIKRVVYIEPYPKSLAMELHADALENLAVSEGGGDSSKVILEPFQGVGPVRYYAVFVRQEDVKKDGAFKTVNRSEAMPADAVNLDAFSTLEKRITEYIKDIELGE